MLGLLSVAWAVEVGEVSTAIAEFNAHADHRVPALDAAKIGKLLDGDVVRVLQRGDPDEPATAVAYAITDLSREALWIAAQDPHTKVDPDLTEAVIESFGVDDALWYGHWDLPRPVKDRQWLVHSRNHHALAAATANRGWEHSWRLVPDGLARVRDLVARGAGPVSESQVDEAIYTPVNHGAWFMVSLSDGGTLYGYQATTVVGGAIPDWIVARMVHARLETVLRDLAKRARTWSPGHYTGGHAPVYGGDGEVIPRF